MNVMIVGELFQKRGIYENLDQDDLKLNIEQLTAVLNKLDNDGYLADYYSVKEEFQVDLLSKIIKTIEKQGEFWAWTTSTAPTTSGSSNIGRRSTRPAS